MAANQLTPEEKLARKRESDRRSKAKWRKANPDLNRARTAAWRKENPEKQQENLRKFHEQNPDWKRQHNGRYRIEHAEEIRQQREGRKEETSVVKKKWYEANQEKQRAYAIQYAAKHPEQHAEAYKRFVALPANRMRMLVSDAGTRARKRGLEFDGLRDIAISLPTACPCCSNTLDYTKKIFNLSPSLDRVNNSRGYTLDNVRVICRRCNSLKRDASIEDVERILAYMRRG
jgi:hypothetical protein